MNVVGVILGGGAGKRLLPLTRDRAKPAVPIAGKYRLVDIPISNCIRSHIRRIYVLTQFNSVSLHQHIQDTYKFDPFHHNFIRVLAAQQTPWSEAWYQGTADAVRKTFSFFMDTEPDLIVILSGDQLYRMDFMPIIEEHLERDAEVTICTKPVPRREAGALGILQADAQGRITRFVEKPGETPLLDELRAPIPDQERYLASMGIYVFNTPVLKDLLRDDSMSDFGKHIIPSAIEQQRVYSYIFDGYWKDIGTMHSFWEANLSLTDPIPPFNFYDEAAPIYTHMRFLPPSKINRCQVEKTLLSEGCIISADRVRHSIVGVRAVVGSGTVVEDSVVMGADFYETGKGGKAVPLGIGRGCVIRKAIIDKNARIGDGCVITPEGKPDEEIRDHYAVREGIIVIPKNTLIPPGTTI